MRKLLLLIFTFELLNNINAQQIAGTFGKVSITSPNAAALGKYGDIPVSYHTGVPNITIPLYTLKEGGLTLPLQLAYHASGLKVDENASWVGAGWSLIAGGTVSRTVKDKPDERRAESLQQTYGYFSNYGISSYLLNNDAVTPEYFDSEPDMFSFNFNGYSGKFYFDESRKPVIVPEQDVKIEYVYEDTLWNNAPGIGSVLGKSIESFVITTPDGTQYFFGTPDQIMPAPYCDPIEVVSSWTGANGNSMGKVISSWYLYRIRSSDGVNQINFYYTRDKYAFFTYPSSIYGNSSENQNLYYGVKNLMSGVLLSKITTSSNNVEFVPGVAREDLSRWATGVDENQSDYPNQTSPVLGGIRVYDTGASCIRKFDFSYGYFQDTTTTVSTYFSWINTDKKRLKLNSVRELSGNDSIVLPPYVFEYFSEHVPRKLSFGKDHWGFINGANSNTMLYPEVFDNNGSMNQSLNLSVNNREAVWPAMRGGTLKKITYPTGGATEFEFEPNSFPVNGTNRIIGGLRVKSIASTDSITGNSAVTNYEYINTTSGLSSGVLFSKPTYIQMLRNDWAKLSNMMGNNGNGCFDKFGVNENQIRSYILSDNSVRPMETTQGYHIGYGTVKVSKPGNGSSIYAYSVNTPWQINWGNTIATTYINNPGPCDPNIPNYPATPLPTDYYRGELSEELHFNENGDLLTKKEYTVRYTIKNSSTPGRVLYKIPFNLNNASVLSYYAYKTAKKIESAVVEKMFQPNGSYIQTMSQTLFESAFHNQPTKIIVYNSNGDTITKKNKYIFDIRSESFDTLASCENGSSDFLSYIDGLLYTQGYAASFTACPDGYLSPCNLSAQSSFSAALFNPRKDFINCNKMNFTNKTPLNLFQQNHDLVKSTADQNLRPIMWMQDINKNTLLETSEWKNSRLIRSTYAQYINERDDQFGVYPERLKMIELLTPSSQFSSVSISNTGLSIDARYADVKKLLFDKGNQVNEIGRDNLNYAYQWSYNNQYPLVRTVNAYNHLRESLENSRISRSVSFTIGGGQSTSGSANKTIVQVDTADIILSIGTVPNNARVSALYTISGPGQNSVQYYLCSSGYLADSCSGAPSTMVLPNMLPGTYTIDITVNTTFGSFGFLMNASFSYLGKAVVDIGDKEFYYEGFEESMIANSNIGYTGSRSYSGTFNVGFAPPNSRNYIIQWWNYANGKWNFNQQNYMPNTILSGILDEVRVLPADAQMTTYAYDSRFGLIGECDTNGRRIYYEYDALGRLKLVRDQDGNIIKTIDYNYKK